MPQASWPIVGQNFSDTDWRDLFGTESGVIGDLDGSAYRITLPTDSDSAQVGSTTQASTAQVAGFGHRILAGQTEPVEIPVASGAARTDIVALRYDPAFTGPPGPVRLVRIAGTSSGLPTYDDAPPGIEDLPLWSVTRQPGQALSQATLRRLYTRLAPTIEVPAGSPLPLSAPLGTVAHHGTATLRRSIDASGNPAWTVPRRTVSIDRLDNIFNLPIPGNTTASPPGRPLQLDPLPIGHVVVVELSADFYVDDLENEQSLSAEIVSLGAARTHGRTGHAISMSGLTATVHVRQTFRVDSTFPVSFGAQYQAGLGGSRCVLQGESWTAWF